MKKKVLVTGIAGMIGSHLLDKLIESNYYEIIGIDNLSFGKTENIEHHFSNSNFKFFKVDVLDFDALKTISKDVDIIVHLAAVKKIGKSESSLPTLMVNTEGTENIFEIAKTWKSKVIFASTSDVYGMSTDLPFKENGDILLGPSMVKRWSYAVSKLYSEQIAFGYYEEFGIPIVVIRYFGGFSPRSSFEWSGGHIPIFINAILNDKEVIIHGDGKQTRSMAFVSDLVDGTLAAMESEKAIGEIINLGNDEEMSVLDCAHLIHRIANTGKELKLKFVPLKEIFGDYKDITRRIPDLTKAKKILNYAPKVKIEEAIKLTIDIVKKRQKETKKDYSPVA
jgi:UDP-glucose 4-epimerase